MCSARELAHERTRDSLINFFFLSLHLVSCPLKEKTRDGNLSKSLFPRELQRNHIPHVHTPVSIMLYAVSLISHCQRGWVRSKREPREAKEILNKQTNRNLVVIKMIKSAEMLRVPT